jgi:hypothetical protein
MELEAKNGIGRFGELGGGPRSIEDKAELVVHCHARHQSYLPRISGVCQASGFLPTLFSLSLFSFAMR